MSGDRSDVRSVAQPGPGPAARGVDWAGRAALAALGLAALTVAGGLAALGPYADVAALLAPRPPFEERPAAGVTEMAAVLQRIGSAGIDMYLRQLRWDLLVVLANVGWLGIWLHGAAAHLLSARWRRVVATAGALVPAAADLVEDAALALALTSYPALEPTTVAIAGLATQVKLVTFGGAVVAAIGLSISWGVRRVRCLWRLWRSGELRRGAAAAR
ncbi:MAG: hypothetical protein JNN18_08200 [Rubrivivax sp.]|nr:hypothetical protein [Rubrivivax sp.]